MAPAQLYADARGPRWRLVRFLSSVALTTCAIAEAYAQAAAPAQAPGAQPTSETRSMDGTTTPGATPSGGGILGGPTLRLSGLRFTSGADLSETYTTNTLGVGNAVAAGYSSGDFITRLSLSFGAHDHTARFDGDLQYALTGSFFAEHSSYTYLSNYLNALGTATIIPEHLIFRASAFAAPILVNGLGPLAGAGSNSGLRDTYGYSISPDLIFRFGEFARSDTIVSQSSVFFVTPGGPIIPVLVPGLTVPNQYVSYSATEQISSGPDFYRLNWLLTGTGTKSVQAGANFEQVSGTGNVKYAVNREVAVTSTIGYQSFTSNQQLSHSLVGIIAMGGMQITLGPRFQADFSAGRQFNFPSYTGDLSYQFGGFTRLVGSLTDTVTPAAGQLLNGLGALGVNGAGDFLNTNYQVNPAAPPSTISNISAFSTAPVDGGIINNGIFRYRTASLTLVHITDRTQYRLTGYRTLTDTLTPLVGGIQNSARATGFEAGISRNITPVLTGSVGASYSLQDQSGGQFAGRYRIFDGNVGLTYLMTAKMQAYVTATYSARQSDMSLVAASPFSGNLSDASITIGLRRQF